MTDRDRIISKIQMMASKAFHSVRHGYISFHEDNAVSVDYMGYIVKIHVTITKDKRKDAIQHKKKKTN